MKIAVGLTMGFYVTFTKELAENTTGFTVNVVRLFL